MKSFENKADEKRANIYSSATSIFDHRDLKLSENFRGKNSLFGANNEGKIFLLEIILTVLKRVEEFNFRETRIQEYGDIIKAKRRGKIQQVEVELRDIEKQQNTLLLELSEKTKEKSGEIDELYLQLKENKKLIETEQKKLATEEKILEQARKILGVKDLELNTPKSSSIKKKIDSYNKEEVYLQTQVKFLLKTRVDDDLLKLAEKHAKIKKVHSELLEEEKRSLEDAFINTIHRSNRVNCYNLIAKLKTISHSEFKCNFVLNDPNKDYDKIIKSHEDEISKIIIKERRRNIILNNDQLLELQNKLDEALSYAIQQAVAEHSKQIKDKLLQLPKLYDHIRKDLHLQENYLFSHQTWYRIQLLKFKDTLLGNDFFTAFRKDRSLTALLQALILFSEKISFLNQVDNREATREFTKQPQLIAVIDRLTNIPVISDFARHYISILIQFCSELMKKEETNMFLNISIQKLHAAYMSANDFALKIEIARIAEIYADTDFGKAVAGLRRKADLQEIVCLLDSAQLKIVQKNAEEYSTARLKAIFSVPIFPLNANASNIHSARMSSEQSSAPAVQIPQFSRFN